MDALERLAYVQGWGPALVDRLNAQCAKLGLQGEAKLAFAQSAADSDMLSALRGGDANLDAHYAASFGFDSKDALDGFKLALSATQPLATAGDPIESPRRDDPSPGM